MVTVAMPSLLNNWNEDDRIPTRLIEENTEIVLAAYLDKKLLPYAQVENYPWDWSSLSISKKQWDKCKYHLPSDLVNLIDELKKKTIDCRILILSS